MFPARIKENDIQNIHEKSMWVFENVGVDIKDADAREVFKKHGARVDGERVFIPEALLNKALETKVRKFDVQGLEKTVTIGDGNTVLYPTTGNTSILKDGVLYKPTLEDFINTQKLDAGSAVTRVASSITVNVWDVPSNQSARIRTAATLKHHTKPVLGFCNTPEDAEASLELGKRFYGRDKGYYMFGVGNMLSPLGWSAENIGYVNAYAKYNQPICLTCCSMLGVTGPITLGGNLVQDNCEVLSGFIYAQLIAPGLPVVYGNASCGFDMRYATCAMGAIEASLHVPYIKRLAEFYGLPSRCGGALTDSNGIDFQAGVESAMNLMSVLYNNIDLCMHACGNYNGMNMFSMEKYVLDEEMCAMGIHAMSHDTIREGDIDLESIKNVGPGGNYLTEEQTQANFRTAVYVPKVFNREAMDVDHQENIIPEMVRAKKAVEKRLAEYQYPTLSPEQEQIIADAMTVK